LSAQGSEDQLIKFFPLVVADADRFISSELGCSIALDKVAAVSSSSSVLKRLRAVLGPLAGTPVLSTKNLGVDYSAARPQAPRTAKVRRDRLKKVVKRIKKLRLLAAAAGTKAGKIFTMGLLPAAAFGSEITGISDRHLDKLRSIAMISRPPFGMAASRSIKLAVHGDPVAYHGAAAILRWAKEAWKAAYREPWALTIGSLQQA
jgi:hypothetical protein